MAKKRHYTSEEKTKILREHLENQVPISELAEEYGFSPNVFYIWKKQLFETASENIGKKRKKDTKVQSKAEKRIAELELLLSVRETLISELVQENMDLKKKDNGVILTSNGLSRR